MSIPIPDIINKSSTVDFTQVSNKILRNPSISFKAKGILCLLLSNKQGWKSYLTVLDQMSTDGITSIQSGISELEKAGYLLRIQYREKKTKKRRGSFWIYTDIPWNFFNMENTMEILNQQDYECFLFKSHLPENLNLENLNLGNLNIGFLNLENQRLIILIDNNIKNNNIKNNNINISLSGFKNPDEYTDNNSTNSTSANMDEHIPSKTIKRSKPTIEDRNKQYLPLAKRLYHIIRKHKKIKYTLRQIKGWANEIRLLVEQNGISQDRIEQALDWYKEHIGEEYIPVIESGSSLRNKFIKLENAMARCKNGKHSYSNTNGSRNAYVPEKDKYAKALARRQKLEKAGILK